MGLFFFFFSIAAFFVDELVTETQGIFFNELANGANISPESAFVTKISPKIRTTCLKVPVFLKGGRGLLERTYAVCSSFLLKIKPSVAFQLSHSFL